MRPLLFVAMFLFCGFAEMAATETLSARSEDGIDIEESGQNEPDNAFHSFDEDDFSDYSDESYYYSDDEENDDADGGYYGDDEDYSPDYDPEGSGSGALDVDDNEPPLPFQRLHVAQPGRFRQADLPRPVVDISGQRPHVAQPDYVRQSDLPQRAVDINGTDPPPHILPSQHQPYTEHQSASSVGSIMLACVIGGTVLCVFVIILIVLLVVYRCQGSCSPHKNSRPIYRSGYMRAVNHDFV